MFETNLGNPAQNMSHVICNLYNIINHSRWTRKLAHLFYIHTTMIQTTIRELKEGDFFTFRPHEEPNEKQVYVRSHYDRGGKKFAYFPYSDMMDEHFAKGSRVVFTDFNF